MRPQRLVGTHAYTSYMYAFGDGSRQSASLHHISYKFLFPRIRSLLRAYNRYFTEKQKSRMAAFLTKEQHRLVAITGRAAHTLSRPAGRGRGETCRAKEIYHIIRLCQTTPLMFRFNAPDLLAIEYPCMIVDISVAKHRHSASALSGDGSPRFFMLSLLSTCILPDEVKV